MASYSEGREEIKGGREEREKQKDGEVNGIVSPLLPAGPIDRVEDRDMHHPWVVFVTGATCVPSQLDETPNPRTGVGGVW
jgi:hypothetical protein